MFLCFGHLIATMFLCFGQFIGHAFRQTLPIQLGLQHLLVRSSLQRMSNDLVFALFYQSTLLFYISIFKKFICFLMFAWQIAILLYSPPSTFAFRSKRSDKTSANSIEEFALKICLH
jgi:hypothetical protein